MDLVNVSGGHGILTAASLSEPGKMPAGVRQKPK
jgi:hypothetical protein